MRISRRILAGLATASLAITATSCGGGGTSGSFDDTVTVGILHSLSGTMAISESTLVDTEKMAIEEINAAGGVQVGGKSYKIEYIVEDGASDWPTFAEKSKKLIDQDGVPVVFGGWTSASRKAMLPVYESKDAFLYYPIQYEAQECSNNIFYTGATPNQQSEPATDFMYKRSPAAGGDFFLVGSDYVFPRTSNTITKAQVLSIYVIDVSAGDKIPRKGGPGITRSDLLLINKIDLADLVGADLNIMKSDTEFMRKGKPWFFTNLSNGIGVEEITQFLESHIPNNQN